MSDALYIGVYTWRYIRNCTYESYGCFRKNIQRRGKKRFAVVKKYRAPFEEPDISLGESFYAAISLSTLCDIIY